MNNQDAVAYIDQWFQTKGWTPFAFQKKAWSAYLNGQSGLVNAPTGCGKTYATMLGALSQAIADGNKDKLGKIQLIWISPIKALAKEILNASEKAIKGLDMGWSAAIRTGDTSTKNRKKIKENAPEILITTPESMHIIFSMRAYDQYLSDVKTIVIDEWHELMGTKRGVQVELLLSRMKGINPRIKIWGISATIGNMNQAIQVLFGSNQHDRLTIVKSNIQKEIEVESILPDDINEFPWAGHIGIKLLEKVLPIIYKSESTLIFTNTRSMCEIWYQKLLDTDDNLAGIMAMHHGSISKELRDWVENALHNKQLKAVVCTSSLDLGVDFRPVESIVQIGSPKGISRFLQRAGRSGHQPGARSKIYFLPTHAMEIIEGAALKIGVKEKKLESREPFYRSFDVLIQYLMTLACSEGLNADIIFHEVKSCFSYESMTILEWEWLLQFVETGNSSLEAYDEFQKMKQDQNGIYRIINRQIASRHRLSIGTIVSDQSMKIKWENGRKIGTIEEYFIARLNTGDVFWFAGRSLELISIKGFDVIVRKSSKKTGLIPSWKGGRMPLSPQFSSVIRRIMDSRKELSTLPELVCLAPLLEIQETRSSIPNLNELLVEYFEDDWGYHFLIYPFEGRLVHEGLGALLASRIAKETPISFSIAMSDYGLELLSDKKIDINIPSLRRWLSSDNLTDDLNTSVNQIELARRRFRDIAAISGLIFKGFPNKQKKERHLQSSTQIMFDVFNDYEPDNLLYLQAYEESLTFQLEEGRMRQALKRISQQKIRLEFPEMATPFSFPIQVDSMRERLTSEKIKDRIQKMQLLMQ